MMTAKPRNFKGNLSVLALLSLKRTLNRISGDISDTLHQKKLTTSQFGVLEALHNHGPMVQKELAKYILKTSGSITPVIDYLEKLGFVERVRVKEDRRYFEIALTPQGKSFIKKLYPPHVKQVEKIMNQVTVDELKQLVRICQKLERSGGQDVV